MADAEKKVTSTPYEGVPQRFDPESDSDIRARVCAELIGRTVPTPAVLDAAVPAPVGEPDVAERIAQAIEKSWFASTSNEYTDGLRTALTHAARIARSFGDDQ